MASALFKLKLAIVAVSGMSPVQSVRYVPGLYLPIPALPSPGHPKI